MSKKFLFGAVFAHILAFAMMFVYGATISLPVGIGFICVSAVSYICVKRAHSKADMVQKAANRAKLQLLLSTGYAGVLGLMAHMAIAEGGIWVIACLAWLVCLALYVFLSVMAVCNIREIAQDVAEQKELEAELRASAEKLKNMQDGSNA